MSNLFAEGSIDSLKVELGKAKEDTNKVKILYHLANGYLESDPGKTIQFSEEAKVLSKKINYNEGIVDAIILIGKANLSQGNYAVGKELSILALKFAQKIKYSNGEGMAYSGIGTSYLYQSQMDSALSNYTRALSIFNSTGDKEKIANVKNNLGWIYQHNGDVTKAIETYLHCLNLYQDLGKKAGMAKSMYNIAGIYNDQKNYTQALLHYANSLALFKELRSKHGISGCLNGIGIAYYRQLNYPQALNYMLQAFDVSKEMGNKTAMETTLNSIGCVYDMQGDNDNALKYYLGSVKMSKETKNYQSIDVGYVNIGVLYSKNGKGTKAIEYLNRSVVLAGIINDKRTIYTAYQNLAEVYKIQNNFKEAYKHLQLYNELKDSIFSEENSKQINELAVKYETEKKEKELIVKEKNIEGLEKDKKFSRYTLYGLLIGIVLITVIALLWIKNYH